MDLKYLKKNAKWYAYELRKFFPDDESPVATYVCENEVVVLSTKKLYIYYYSTMIDCVFEPLADSLIGKIDHKHYSIEVTLMNKLFHVVFASKEDFEKFLHYYEKYNK